MASGFVKFVLEKLLDVYFVGSPACASGDAAEEREVHRQGRRARDAGVGEGVALAGRDVGLQVGLRLLELVEEAVRVDVGFVEVDVARPAVLVAVADVTDFERQVLRELALRRRT